MQKILLAIDGMKINMNALDFACFLGRLTKSTITGVFLENLVADEKPVLKEAYNIPGLAWELDKDSAEYSKKKEIIEKNIILFKEACCKREINCYIHRDTDLPSKEIIEESRFADIIVIDAETSFNKSYEGSPTEFVKDILKNTECPVVVAPERPGYTIDEIIFTYDGSRASMFAIKQFGYLFPELRSKKAILLQVIQENETSIDQVHNIREWLKTHYASCEYKTLKGDIKAQLLSYLLLKRNAFAVMGSYGRSAISTFFRKSNADIILKTTTLPVFITHP